MNMTVIMRQKPGEKVKHIEFHICYKTYSLSATISRSTDLSIYKIIMFRVVRHVTMYTYIYIYIYRVPQEECARLREGVPYVKVYRYNPKYLCPKLNGYGDNGQRKVWFSGGSTHCTCQLTILSISVLECVVILREFSSLAL